MIGKMNIQKEVEIEWESEFDFYIVGFVLLIYNMNVIMIIFLELYDELINELLQEDVYIYYFIIFWFKI